MPGLCERRIAADWRSRFGHPLWLLETFVDPRRFHGTSYRVANWLDVGDTRGCPRTRSVYSKRAGAPKRVLVRALIVDAAQRLWHPLLPPCYQHGAPKLMLSADQMRSLSAVFAEVPIRAETHMVRHPISVERFRQLSAG